MNTSLMPVLLFAFIHAHATEIPLLHRVTPERKKAAEAQLDGALIYARSIRYTTYATAAVASAFCLAILSKKLPVFEWLKTGKEVCENRDQCLSLNDTSSDTKAERLATFVEALSEKEKTNLIMGFIGRIKENAIQEAARNSSYSWLKSSMFRAGQLVVGIPMSLGANKLFSQVKEAFAEKDFQWVVACHRVTTQPLSVALYNATTLECARVLRPDQLVASTFKEELFSLLQQKAAYFEQLATDDEREQLVNESRQSFVSACNELLDTVACYGVFLEREAQKFPEQTFLLCMYAQQLYALANQFVTSIEAILLQQDAQTLLVNCVITFQNRLDVIKKEVSVQLCQMKAS